MSNKVTITVQITTDTPDVVTKDELGDYIAYCIEQDWYHGGEDGTIEVTFLESNE